MFTLLKGIHVTTVCVTLGLFILRSALAFRHSPNLRHPVLRWLPHANDTVLLGSALGAAALLGQYPFVNDWLTAKVLALLLYIALGHVALWRVRNDRQRALWTAAALAVFVYIVLVARCHDPNPGSCIGG